MSSPFDNNSLLFLQNELKINTIKIPSGEITNFKLLSNLKNNSVILSTGMSNLNEIAEAINVIFNKIRNGNYKFWFKHYCIIF